MTKYFVQVGTNGYFTFDNVFTDYSNFEFPGVGINTLVAPFFCDQDISKGLGSIRYEIHTRKTSEALIAKVNLVINKKMGTDFSGVWTLLAEWKDAPEYGRSHYFVSHCMLCNKPNYCTFCSKV